MSRVVDNRVVEMEFDNSNFEKNVGTSLSTLDKLKAALSFKGTDDDFSLVERGAERVGKSFSLMEQVATGALRSFGTKLENWATNTIKTMSGVNNVIEGMDKFEKITKSSATLLAQGFSTKEVRRELNKLNWFTDETSYNLTDMVDNISKFTATGQGLQESADAMMGIALWAAKAGQDAPTASRAMYQLSQAMGAYMRKEDWKSVQNANMDMKEFRQLAMDTAVELKTLKKNTDGTYQSLVSTSKAGAKAFTVSQFADSLTEGAWFTPEVMMKVYSKYNKAAQDIYGYMQKHVGATVQDAIDALGDSLDEFSLKAFLAGQEARSWGDAVNSVKDALSTKWMGIFQHIFGSSKQATKFFTDLAYSFYDMFVEPMSGVVESFHLWRNAFGRKAWQQSLISMLESLNGILNTVRESFDRFMFGDRADKLVSAAKSLRTLYEFNGETYKRARKGYQVLMPDDDSDGIIEARAQAMLELTHKFTVMSGKFAVFAKETDMFERLINGILSAVGLIVQAVKGLWTALDPFKPLIKDLFGWAVNRVLDLADAITELYSKAKANNTFVKLFTSILKPFVTLKDKIGEFIDKFVPRFQKRWNDFASHFSFVGDKVDSLKQKFSGFADSIKSKWENLFGNWDIDKTIDGLFVAFGKVKKVVYDLIGVSDDEGFANWLEETYNKAAAWVRKFRADAKSTFGSIWEDLKGYWTKAQDWLDKNWGKISKTVSDVVGAIWGFFKGFWTSFSKIFESEEGGGSAFQKIVDGVKKFGEILGNIFQTIWNGLQPFVTAIRNTIESLNFENAGEFLKGGGIAALGVAFYKWSTGFGKSSWLLAFKNILEGIGEALGGMTHLLDAKAFKEVAIGIGILVAALLILIAIPVEDLTRAATVMALIITIITNGLKQLTGFKSSATLDAKGLSYSKSGSASSILMVALAFVAIAAVLGILAAIPEKALYRAATVVSLIMGIMTLMLKAIAKMYGEKGETNKKNNYKNKIASGNALVKVGGPASIIFSFAILIAAVIFAIKQLSDMIGDEKSHVTGAILIIAGIITAITGILMLLGEWYRDYSDDHTKHQVSNTVWKNLLAFAASIYIVALAFEKIANSGASETGMNYAIGVIGGIMVIMTVMAGIAKNGDFSSVNKLSGALLVFSVSIALVGGVVALLATVFDKKKEGALKASLYGIALIGAILAAATAVTLSGKFDSKKLKDLAVGLITISGAIAVAAGAMLLLAQIPENEIMIATGGLLAIMVAFATAGIIGTKVGDGLIVFSKAILYVAASLALVAVGFLAAAAAIQIFSDSQLNVEQAAKNIAQFIDQIVTKVPEWTNKILTSLLETILAAIPATLISVVDTFATTLAGLVEKDPITGKMKIETIVENAIKVILAVIDEITANMADIVNSVGKMVVELLKNLGSWVQTNKKDISDAISSVVDGLIDIIIELFAPLGKKIFGEAWDGKNGIATLLETTAKAFLGLTVVNWVKGWVSKIGGVLGSLSSVLTGIMTKIASIIAAHPVLTGIVAGLGAASYLASDYNSDEDRRSSLMAYADKVAGKLGEDAVNKKFAELMQYGSDLRYENGYLVGKYADEYYTAHPNEDSYYNRKGLSIVVESATLPNGEIVFEDVGVKSAAKHAGAVEKNIIGKTTSFGGSSSGRKNTYVQIVESPKPVDRGEIFRDGNALLGKYGWDLDMSSLVSTDNMDQVLAMFSQ